MSGGSCRPVRARFPAGADSNPSSRRFGRGRGLGTGAELQGEEFGVQFGAVSQGGAASSGAVQVGQDGTATDAGHSGNWTELIRLKMAVERGRLPAASTGVLKSVLFFFFSLFYFDRPPTQSCHGIRPRHPPLPTLPYSGTHVGPGSQWNASPFRRVSRMMANSSERADPHPT